MDAEQQFQTAAHLHQSGDLAGAEKILTDLATAIPDHPDILHFLGLVQLQAERPDAAVETLKQVTALKPEWPVGFDMLGCALRQSGRLDAAIRQLRKAIKLDPDNAQSYYNLGNAFRDSGQFDEAARNYNKAILINPDYMDACFNLGQALFNLGKLVEAVAAFRRVFEHDASDSEAGISLAKSLIMQNNFPSARKTLEAVVGARPEEMEAWALLADVAMQLQEFDRAIACYDQQLAQNPTSSEILRGKAGALQLAGDAEAAVESCRQALAIAPEDPENLFNLAFILERLNNLEEAREIATKGLSFAPDHPGLSLIAARLERRDGDVDKALDRLTKVVSIRIENSLIAGEVHFELGRLYELQNRPGDAIENFSIGNGRMADDPEMVSTLKTRSLTYLQKVRDAYDNHSDFVIENASADSANETPVFVVGFPRSGTTLLDQVLDAHPAIQVLEEQLTMFQVQGHLIRQGNDFPSNLFDLPESDFVDMRRLYFQAVDNCIERNPSALLVDKMPLNIIDAGLIHRLFPKAKFILALRHPCDVCLSCFMQPFRLNEAMANFTTLEDTVSFYDQVLNLWYQQREALNLSVHEVRYEDLVTGLEPVARDLLEFLDVPWDDAVLDPTGHARQQKFIGTSSYHQVVETINTRAVDRWRKYELHLTPFMRRLSPHIDALGYNESS